MNNDKKVANHFYWHVLLFSSLIFSQPLFSTLSSQPEFLLAHNLGGLNLFYWILAVALSTGVLLIAMIYLLIRLLPGFGNPVKIMVIFSLISLFSFIHLNQSNETYFALSIALSILSGVIITAVYWKSTFLRTFFTFTSILVVINPAVFSLDAGVRQILLPEKMIANTSLKTTMDSNPVVIIILDELPLLSLLDKEGAINAVRFPNLAGFSAQSTWYRYATTVAEATQLAVPSFLTGMIISTKDQKLPLAANYPNNLFTLFSDTHRVNAFETFTQLCPDSLCNNTTPDWKMIAEDTLVIFAHIITPNRLKPDLPQIDNKWVGYIRNDVSSENDHNDTSLHPHHRYKVRLKNFGLFWSELKNIERTSLNYLHILMPHSPWMYLQDGRVYSLAELKSFTGTLPDEMPGAKHKQQLYDHEHLVDYAHQRHLLQMGFTDKLLGDIFVELKSLSMFDDALIVVTADHGASFRPGESLRQATDVNYQDILSVPLFIKYPGQEKPMVDLRAARTIDVLPTILDSLHNDIGNLNFDGRSLLRDSINNLTTLALERDTGEILTFPFLNFKARLDQAIRSRKAEFANGKFDTLYEINAENLINELTQQFHLDPGVDYTLELDNLQLYEDIDLASRNIPTLIRANLPQKNQQPAKEVAVSVNGIIRAVSVLQKIKTVVFDFQALVAPESFNSGANIIQFYEVNRVQGNTRLSPIPVQNINQAALVHEAINTSSLVLDGQRLPVTSYGGCGEINIIAGQRGDSIQLTGWSAGSQDGQVASEVFFFADSELIASMKPHLPYLQAQEQTGFKNALNAGFNLSIPITVEHDSVPREFKAIALFDSKSNSYACELHYVNQAENQFLTSVIPVEGDMFRSAKETETISPGRIYDFSDNTQALLFSGPGWSNVSSGGARWNAAAQAVLKFKVPDDAFPLELAVKSSPFYVKGKLETQVIEASLLSGTKQIIKLQREETDGKFLIRIEKNDIDPDGNVVIQLNFPNAASPRSLGVNNDGRMLAVKVISLQVLIAKDNSHVPGSVPSQSVQGESSYPASRVDIRD